MKEFSRYWFKPIYQRKGKPVVEFELMPLDHGTYMVLDDELTGRYPRMNLTPRGRLEAFNYGVRDWRGLETAFSEEAKLRWVNGVADRDLGIWMREIALDLLRRAVLGSDEVKNS